MRRIDKGCLWFLFPALLLGVPLASAREAALSTVVETPAQFDGQTLTLRGTITALKETVSRGGNDYTTFKLQDAGGRAVNIFKWGHPSLKDGDWVEVEGIFRQTKHVAAYTFHNEVEAQSIRVRVVKRVPVDPTTLPPDFDH
jgi:hypothetical protein